MVEIKQFFTAFIQIGVGLALTILVPGGAAFGVPLIIAGGLQAVSIFIFPAPNAGEITDSPTYSLTPIGNQRGEGGPNTIIYGEIRTVPLLISINTDVVEDRDVIRALFLIGKGVLADMSDWKKAERIRLNDQLAQVMDPDIGVEFRRGTVGQSVIPGFNGVGIGYASPSTAKIDGGVPWVGAKVEYDTKEAVDEVRLLLTWPNGISRTSSKGDFESNAGGAAFSFLNLDEPGSDWVPYELHKDDVGDWVKFGPNTGGGRNRKGVWVVIERNRSAVRKTFRMRFPKKAKYRVRVSATLSDNVQDTRTPVLTSIIEFKEGTFNYEGDALMGLTIHANEQLQGRLPRVTLLTRGREGFIPPLQGNQHTREPAWCLRDALLLAGGPVKAADIDDGVGGSFRDAVDNKNTTIDGEKKFELDLAMDRRGSARDWIGKIESTFRVSLVFFQGKWRLVPKMDFVTADKVTFDDNPSPGAGRRPIIQASDERRSGLQVLSIPERERFTRVVGHFLNRDDWQRDTIDYPDEGGPAEPTPKLKREFFIVGITRSSQIMRELKFFWDMAQSSTALYAWPVGIGDHHLVPGQPATIYSDHEFGPGGFVESIIQSVLWSRGGVGLVVAREWVGSQVEAKLSTTIIKPKPKPPLVFSLARVKAFGFNIEPLPGSEGKKNI